MSDEYRRIYDELFEAFLIGYTVEDGKYIWHGKFDDTSQGETE